MALGILYSNPGLPVQYSLDSDPTVFNWGGTNAEIGSILYRTDAPTIYRKSGPNTTDWTIQASSFSGSVPAANSVLKSNGTGIVASQMTDDGTNISIPGTVSIGNINVQELINGPTFQAFAIPSTSYAFGEVNREEISGVVPSFPADLFVHVIRNSATADTTTHTQTSGGMAIEVTGSRSAGANNMINTALECIAQNAQQNRAIHVGAGDFLFDGGGAITQNTGTAFFAGTFLAALGTIFAESNGADAIDISGTPTHAIKMRKAASIIDVQNPSSPATASSLTIANSSAAFTLIVGGPIRLTSATGVLWTSGAGTPEGAVTAPVGSIFSRTDGGAGTSFYVKESGAGNVGWVAK